VVVRCDDIDEIVDHHCLNFLVMILREETLAAS